MREVVFCQVFTVRIIDRAEPSIVAGGFFAPVGAVATPAIIAKALLVMTPTTDAVALNGREGPRVEAETSPPFLSHGIVAIHPRVTEEEMRDPHASWIVAAMADKAPLAVVERRDRPEFKFPCDPMGAPHPAAMPDKAVTRIVLCADPLPAALCLLDMRVEAHERIAVPPAHVSLRFRGRIARMAQQPVVVQFAASSVAVAAGAPGPRAAVLQAARAVAAAVCHGEHDSRSGTASARIKTDAVSQGGAGSTICFALDFSPRGGVESPRQMTMRNLRESDRCWGQASSSGNATPRPAPVGFRGISEGPL